MTCTTRAAVAFIALAVLAVPSRASAQQTGTRNATLVPVPIGPNGEKRDMYAGSYALLIGESRYDVPTAWASLDSVPGELDNLAAALRDLGFDRVETLKNPSSDELKTGVERFMKQYGYNTENRLLFFFSGHGFTLNPGARGFFVPRDAPDPLTDEGGFRSTALAMEQVATWARLMSAKHALFAFDSCFSGTIFHTRGREVAEHLSKMTASPVREFLTAGGADEKVPSRSVFTPAFVRALRGDADLDHDGYVTGSELGNYVQREVIGYAKGQTPQFGKLNDPDYDLGDIVFMVPSDSPGPVTITPATRAGAGRRIALVVGNGAYRSAPLATPVNDAMDLADMLADLKFDVTLATDTTRAAMQRSIDAFVQKTQPGDVAVVYFAGHGLQIDGDNYLLPVDFASGDAAQARSEGYSASVLDARLTERGAAAHILLLDASRNNPYSTDPRASFGLAPPMPGERGSLVAMSAAPNQVADDPAGRNSRFAATLVAALRKPGLTVEQMLTSVRSSVYTASEGRQVPYVASSMIGDFYFRPPDAPPPAPRNLAVSSGATAAPVDDKTAIAQTLEEYKNAYQTMDVERLRKVYPAFANFTALQQRFADLQSIAVAMGTPQITIIADGTAVATCLYSMTFTARTGKNDMTKPSRAEFRLRKVGATWIIDSLAYR
jgi:uncharacterized caspase-like protein